MRRIVALISLLIGSLAGYAQQQDNRLKGLDSLINRLLQEWNVPGASVTVVEKNKVLMANGFGFKDLENRQPVTENTLFAIGSCTKAFTASLLNFAIEDKGIDLDAPVGRYLPELQFYTGELTTQVTLRDMLTHRTGLPRHDYSWFSGVSGNRDSLLFNIRFLEPSLPLRQSFQYNNYMYMAVGSLLEKLYGKPWESLLAEKLLLPLGMAGTSTGSISQITDFARGYVYSNHKFQAYDLLPDYLKGIAPAGGISSGAKDMSRWLLMWTNQGKSGSQQLISPAFYQQAISSQMVVNANLPSRFMPDYYFFNYGLGWYIANYRGHYGVGHGGNISGFSSFISFLPTDTIGVYVSVNQHHSELPRLLTNLIMDRLIGAEYRDWNGLFKQMSARKTQPEETPKNQAPPTHALAAYSGVFSNKAYGSITIREDKGVLTGRYNRWKLNIRHHQYNYFKFSVESGELSEQDSFQGEFTVQPDGRIGSLKIPFETTVRDIEFSLESVPVVQTSNAIKKYEGSYAMMGKECTLYVAGNGMLKARLPGQPEYELLPVQADEYSVKGVKGVLVQFEKNAAGEITGFTMKQAGGVVKATRKK